MDKASLRRICESATCLGEQQLDYRATLYKRYVGGISKPLFGEVTLQSFENQFPLWANRFERLIEGSLDSPILDLGCGNGGFVYFLQRRGYKCVNGIDVSEAQVGVAHELGIESVVLGDAITHLRGHHGYYSAIFARDVLEHFQKSEILPLLDAINDALVPGGCLIVQVPNGESPFGGRYRYGDFTHELAFTAVSLGQLFEASKFDRCSFYSCQPVVHSIKSAVRYTIWKVIDAMIRVYMLVEVGTQGDVYTQNLIAKACKRASVPPDRATSQYSAS